MVVAAGAWLLQLAGEAWPSESTMIVAPNAAAAVRTSVAPTATGNVDHRIDPLFRTRILISSFDRPAQVAGTHKRAARRRPAPCSFSRPITGRSPGGCSA